MRSPVCDGNDKSVCYLSAAGNKDLSRLQVSEECMAAACERDIGEREREAGEKEMLTKSVSLFHLRNDSEQKVEAKGRARRRLLQHHLFLFTALLPSRSF